MTKAMFTELFGEDSVEMVYDLNDWDEDKIDWMEEAKKIINTMDYLIANK